MKHLAVLAVLAVAAPAAADTPPKAAKPTSAAEVNAACKTTASYDAKQPDKIKYKTTNTAKREVRMCWLQFYLYAKDGTQIAHRALPINFKIKPGDYEGTNYEFHELAKDVAGRAVDSVEVTISSAKFTDGTTFEDPALDVKTRPRSTKSKK